MADKKKCTGKCGKERPIGDFYKLPQTSDGRKSMCKYCCTDLVKENQARHRKERDFYAI